MTEQNYHEGRKLSISVRPSDKWVEQEIEISGLIPPQENQN
jgi:hypothetical protein